MCRIVANILLLIFIAIYHFLNCESPSNHWLYLQSFFWDNQSSESGDGFHSTGLGGNAPCLWLLWRPQLSQSTRVTLIIKGAAMGSLWYPWRLLGVRIRDDRDRRPLSSEAVLDRSISMAIRKPRLVSSTSTRVAGGGGLGEFICKWQENISS